MDALRSLKAALANARWLSRTDEALALVPDLVSEMPGLVLVEIHGSEQQVAPCAFSQRLRGALEELLLARLDAAQGGRAAEAIRDLNPAALSNDGLVRVLTDLLCESAVFGVEAQTLVVLELVRQSSGLLVGDDMLLRHSTNEGKLRGAVKRLGSLSPEQRGEVLGALAFSLQARLGVAYARTGGLARPGRVYQALAASRLPLVLRTEDLEFPRDLVLVARVIELPATRATLDATWLAAKSSLEEGLAQDSGAGATLRALAGEGASIQVQLLNPQVVGLSLSLLPALLTEDGLRKRGLSVAEARSMLGPGLVAATTGLLEVVKALRRLDLLSCLSASVLPVERVGGQWQSEGTPVRAPLLSLLSPCSLEEASHGHVVGATLGAELASGLASHSLALPALGALDQFWERMRARALELDGRAVRSGPPFIAVFATAPGAQTFEEELRAGLDELHLDLGVLGQLRLSGLAQVGSAEGPLAGGWSGESVRVQGPPIEAILRAAPLESVWDSEPLSREERSTGPIEDPFAPTPVRVEEDAGPPDDWGSLSDLVGNTGELPALEGPAEDLGEAVSYDLLGAFELASRQDPEVDRLLEPFSQDTIPDSESMLGDSLDMDVHEELAFSTEPSLPELSSDLDLSSDQDLFSEPPELSTGSDAASLEEESFDVEIEDDEDDEEEDSEDDLFEDELSVGLPEISFVDLDPDAPSASSEPQAYFLPPPGEPSAPSIPSMEQDFDGEWDDESSWSSDPGRSEPSWEDESSAYTPISEAPAFPDLGITLDEPMPEDEPEPEPHPQLVPEHHSEPSELSSPTAPALSRGDLGFLFQGYVLVRVSGATVFGRSYGATLADVHRYPTEHIGDAYFAFAKDKIRERFSPSSEDTWTLSALDRADPVSLDQLMQAIAEAQDS